jgi:large subunit ribosomal protein L9
MKVILLDYVYKHGVAGEVIDVADGFARNFLIPRKLAVKATEGEMRRAAKLREQAAAKRAALENRMNEVARAIDGVELVFGRRAAPTGKLFGSVTTQEIADALLEKTGMDINRRRISQQPLREVGTHDVPVRLGSEISPVLKITIVREEELAEYLQQQAAAAAAEQEGEGEAVAEMVAEGEVTDLEAAAVEAAEADVEAEPEITEAETAEAPTEAEAAGEESVETEEETRTE